MACPDVVERSEFTSAVVSSLSRMLQPVLGGARSAWPLTRDDQGHLHVLTHTSNRPLLLHGQGHLDAALSDSSG